MKKLAWEDIRRKGRSDGTATATTACRYEVAHMQRRLRAVTVDPLQPGDSPHRGQRMDVTASHISSDFVGPGMIFS